MSKKKLQLQNQQIMSEIPDIDNQNGIEEDKISEILQNDENEEADGAINEKARFYKSGSASSSKIPSHLNKSRSDFDATQNIAHHLHAIVGLDRYPNYLSRWSIDDVDALEKSMEEKLKKVREQKHYIETQREFLSQLIADTVDIDPNTETKDRVNRKINSDIESLLNVPTSWDTIRDEILDPRASEVIFGSKWFSKKKKVPTVHEVIRGKVDIQLDDFLLGSWMDQEMFDVYSFPLFSKEFCKRIQSFVQKVQHQIKTNPKWKNNDFLSPGGKRQRPIDLDTVGLGWINSLLFQLIIRPISRHLFTETEIQGELDWRQGYVASYAPKSNKKKTPANSRLVPHTDDSEVTLNLCLGDFFTGGNVKFSGLRGTRDEGIVLGEFEPVVGTALLHAGRHLHEVTEVMSGNRFVLIVWARSWGGIRASTCPCCWLNRRTFDDNGDEGRRGCICRQKWN